MSFHLAPLQLDILIFYFTRFSRERYPLSQFRVYLYFVYKVASTYLTLNNKTYSKNCYREIRFYGVADFNFEPGSYIMSKNIYLLIKNISILDNSFDEDGERLYIYYSMLIV